MKCFGELVICQRENLYIFPFESLVVFFRDLISASNSTNIDLMVESICEANKMTKSPRSVNYPGGFPFFLEDFFSFGQLIPQFFGELFDSQVVLHEKVSHFPAILFKDDLDY